MNENIVSVTKRIVKIALKCDLTQLEISEELRRLDEIQSGNRDGNSFDGDKEYIPPK